MKTAHLKDRHQDMASSLTCHIFIVFAIMAALLAGMMYLFPDIYAEVYVPENEYLGYFDSEKIYTVIGNVKNENSFAVIPTVTVSVVDGKQIFYKTIKHVPVAAGSEVPFKIKFPQINSESPVLQDPVLEFMRTEHMGAPLHILYDDTLVTHPDGHLTGRVQNTGDRTIYFPTIHAVVHGHDSPLDVVQNMNLIEKIEPGEIASFSMYPDPAITTKVLYYSCFAPVDTTVIPVTVNKNNGKFDFRYDSGAWFSAAEFDMEGTTMTMRGYNSYPLETYANFEFVPISGTEKFSVTINDMPVEFIQSIDEMGFWHIAFSVQPTSQGILKISGFEKGLPSQLPVVPQWIKTSAGWWSTGEISDSEFLEGIYFMIEKGIIPMPQNGLAAESDRYIPQWVGILSEWWHEDKISDSDFVMATTYLIDLEVIRI